jgi:hypothetical protein
LQKLNTKKKEEVLDGQNYDKFHPSGLLDILATLAKVKERLGKFSDTEKLYRTIAEKQQRMFGERRKRYMRTLRKAALCMKEKDQLEQCVALLIFVCEEYSKPQRAGSASAANDDDDDGLLMFRHYAIKCSERGELLAAICLKEEVVGRTHSSTMALTEQSVQDYAHWLSTMLRWSGLVRLKSCLSMYSVCL